VRLPALPNGRPDNWKPRTVPGLTLIFCAACLCVPAASAPLFAQMYPGQSTGQQSSGQSHGLGAVIVVNVVGDDGDPMGEGAQVTISSEGDAGRSDVAGSNGVVRFVGVSRGDYAVTVRDPGYKDGFGSVEVASSYGQFSTTVTLEADTSSDADAKGMMLAPKAKAEFDKGVDAMRERHYDEAQKHLEAAYKLAPGNPDVNDKLGELYLLTRNLERAQQYLQNALSIDPDNESALTDTGELRIEQSDYPSAEKSLSQAVSLYPDDWFAHWMLGVVYLRMNENEKARSEAAAAIKSGKRNANDAEYLLGEALAKLGRTDEAIHALQLFIKDAPKNSYAPAAKVLIAKLQSGGAPGSEEGVGPAPAQQSATR
jgi:Flp pilus assembly protein TadD